MFADFYYSRISKQKQAHWKRTKNAHKMLNCNNVSNLTIVKLTPIDRMD